MSLGIPPSLRHIRDENPAPRPETARAYTESERPGTTSDHCRLGAWPSYSRYNDGTTDVI